MVHLFVNDSLIFDDTEKARKKSDEMTEKARKKSKEIERDFEKPIAALKSSLVTQKLVKIMKDQGEYALSL